MENDDVKVCSKCFEAKIAFLDFYMCQGKFRSECKRCTIKKNVKYQRTVQAWKYRFVDNDERKSYMVEYYARNKEKFAAYRKKFKEKHPGYHKLYARARKNKQ